ncbi:MAG: RIP metalloprotease RseP [Acidobacteria bacterium]|nr:RIP metalloprotease RseP [Acidobacteriota bacterium]
MLNTLNSLLAFVFVLGVLVFVHELGHYLVARWLGVRVITFSIGFGPKLLKFSRGGTEYAISAFPLGGYVKMAGENPDDPQTGAPDEFLSRSKWDRFRILLAGPVMNIVLAVTLMTVVLAQGAQVPVFQDDPVDVGMVTKGSPAERSGIRAGDRIIKVGSSNVATWEQFYLAIGGRADREVPVAFLREGRESVVTVTPEAQTKMRIGDIGVLPNVHPRIASVEPNGPADKAGVKSGDLVLALNGETIVFSAQLSAAIKKRPEQAITLRVQRGNDQMEIAATPRRQGTLGVLGVGLQDPFKLVKPGPLGAVKLSIERNVQFAGLIVQTLGGLFTRETSPRQLMGPVAIAQLSGDYAAAGVLALFTFMASLSLNLGLLNLLPIPVLDGGHIFIMAVEGVVRRDFSVKMKERLLLAGFFVLMMLMVTVVYNDLTRFTWFERLIPGGK